MPSQPHPRWPHRARALTIAALAIAPFVAAFGCGGAAAHTTRLEAARNNPAAQGELRAEEAGNGNVRLMVTAHHLAPPERVASGATVYVVWVRAPVADAHPVNVGAMRPDDKLDGSLETLTTLTDFDVEITAEGSPSVQNPSSAIVFTGHGSLR
jgi:hypothetical protein